MTHYYVDLENTGINYLLFLENNTSHQEDRVFVFSQAEIRIAPNVERYGYPFGAQQADFAIISVLTEHLCRGHQPDRLVICTEDRALTTAFLEVAKRFGYNIGRIDEPKQACKYQSDEFLQWREQFKNKVFSHLYDLINDKPPMVSDKVIDQLLEKMAFNSTSDRYIEKELIRTTIFNLQKEKKVRKLSLDGYSYLDLVVHDPDPDSNEESWTEIKEKVFRKLKRTINNKPPIKMSTALHELIFFVNASKKEGEAGITKKEMAQLMERLVYEKKIKFIKLSDGTHIDLFEHEPTNEFKGNNVTVYLPRVYG